MCWGNEDDDDDDDDNDDDDDDLGVMLLTMIDINSCIIILMAEMVITSESVITTCFKVYCPWPGYLEGGKVNTITQQIQ